MAANVGRLFIVLFGGLVEGNVKSCLRSRSVQEAVNLSLTPSLFLPPPVQRAGQGLPALCQLLWDEQRDYRQVWKAEASISRLPEGRYEHLCSPAPDSINQISLLLFSFLFLGCLCRLEDSRRLLLSYLHIGLGGFLKKDLWPNVQKNVSWKFI